MKKVLLGALISIPMVIGLIAYSYLSGGCVKDQSFAKAQVIEHLEREGFPIGSLKFDPKRSSQCKVSFIYQNTMNEIYFSVIDGGKVTWWNVNERGPL